MKGWLVAVLCAGGWAATCVEARRRWTEDGKALRAAQVALRESWTWVEDVSASAQCVKAVAAVNAALEARG